MPFDEEPIEEGGGGDDRHEDIEGIAAAMEYAAYMTAKANGKCVNCAMSAMAVNVAAQWLVRVSGEDLDAAADSLKDLLTAIGVRRQEILELERAEKDEH